MRILLGLSVAAVWLVVCALVWIALEDVPLLPARKPAPGLDADTCVYLDRDYRLETVPDFLRDAVVVRTFRHGADPVHLRLDGPGVLWFLAAEGEPPAAWGAVEAATEPVLCRGAATDLTRAWRRDLAAGDHVVEPLGPRRVASPLLVVASREVRVVETPAGMLRRAELGTRGYPRRALAGAIVFVGGVALLLAVLVAGRRRRRIEAA